VTLGWCHKLLRSLLIQATIVSVFREERAVPSSRHRRILNSPTATGVTQNVALPPDGVNPMIRCINDVDVFNPDGNWLSSERLSVALRELLKMASVITREIIEIIAGMQAKALAFDSEHPNHALGRRSAAQYAAAIRALVPEQEQLHVGELMLAAGGQAMGLLMLSCADTRRAS
jgi:hypothetical protein